MPSEKIYVIEDMSTEGDSTILGAKKTTRAETSKKKKDKSSLK